MKNGLPVLLFGLLILFSGISGAEELPVSEATSECLECHTITHPGIVESWQKSRHSMITPKQGMSVEGLARKVSSKTVPDALQSNVVGCAECHALRPGAHADTFDHNGHDIHVVVSPDDCAVCHSTEAGQYAKNIMSHAFNNLNGNPLFGKLEVSITGRKKFKDGKIAFEPPDDETRAETCYYCHGTRLKVAGTEVRDTELAGEMEFPVIEGWPNQGVGRVNLDGSRGSCSACHTRHTFAIEMARKPYTCKECHVGPDVPAFKVYAASKHGNIFSAMNKSWNFDAVPWTIGQDFTAPTCAACHISLLVNTDGDVVSERTHQMNNRLAWRIFGLVYATPHPRSPDTTVIRNKDGQPLPASLDGEFATEFLIDEKEMNKRRQTMQAACLNCHGSSWVNGQWQRFENTIRETNSDIQMATGIMDDIWKKGLADLKTNPFDEPIEKKWTDAWQLYANTTRFASAMGGGGDYGVYAGGRYQLSQALLEINEWRTVREQITGGSK